MEKQVGVVGEIVSVKLSNQDVLIIKWINHSDVQVLFENGIQVNRIVSNCYLDINMYCIFPPEMQKGIQLTYDFDPPFTLKDKVISSVNEFGHS